MILGLVAVLFGIFVINVVMGSSGGERILGDVGEMLVLLAASCVFVVAILQQEARRTRRRADENDQ